MNVRVLSVSRMPYNTRVWVDERDDGRFLVYMDVSLISEAGAECLQAILNTHITGWKRLDRASVIAALRSVSG